MSLLDTYECNCCGLRETNWHGVYPKNFKRLSFSVYGSPNEIDYEWDFCLGCINSIIRNISKTRDDANANKKVEQPQEKEAKP